MKLDQILFRYESLVNFWTAGYFDDDGDYLNIGSGTSRAEATIYLTRWRCFRVTPKGGWVSEYRLATEKHWVGDANNKKWAYPTREEAWASFQIRLRRRWGHWKTEGRRLDAIGELADTYGDTPPPDPQTVRAVHLT